MSSTRPVAVAVIHRISSGTSVPAPRTSRVNGPFFTVPNHNTVWLSAMLGDAGSRRETATLNPMTATPTTPAAMMRLRFLRLRIGGISLHVHTIESPLLSCQ